MEDPYNCEEKPTNQWINDHCDYRIDNGGEYFYKDERWIDRLQRKNNKCKMLNNEWKLLQWENIQEKRRQ